MFKVLYWTPFTAGIVDGLNPCFLMTFALVILGMMWFKNVGINRAWVFVFLGMMIFDTFAFNCGLLDRFVLSGLFQLVSRVLYVALAVVAGMRGIRLLREWFDLSRGKEVKPPLFQKNKWSPFKLFVILGIVALLLTMMATLWPINAYIMTFTVYMMMPGQFIVLGSLVFLYTLITFWFVLAGLAIFLIEAKNQRLFKIVAAAILLSASLGVLDIIFTKG